MPRPVEGQLQRQLNRSGPADLIQRAETAVGAARAQAARQGLRRLAEEAVGNVVVRLAEVRVVEDVEEFGAKTKPEPLRHCELPLQGEIRLPRSETSQHVASEITLVPCGGGTPCPDLI